MSDTEKENNTQNEISENPTENETSKNEGSTNEAPIKLKKSSSSRRKSKKNADEEGSFSQDLISSSMSFAVDQHEVLDLINQIINQIENTKNKLNIESFLTEPLENTKQVQKEIEDLPTITKEESKKITKSLRNIVEQVSKSWNPPLTDSVREDLIQIRNQLNTAIVALHGPEAPLSELKGLEVESMNNYIIEVSKKIDDPNKFFNAVIKASDLVLNRDVGLLEEGLKDLSEYINNAEAPYDTFVNQMYYAFLYYQAAAIKTSYFGRKEFESNVQKFFETQPEELRDICFEIVEHFYTILSKANPRSIEKDHDTIVKDLYYSLASPSKMDLARTYYYLKTYSYNSKHLLFFKNTLNDIKSCFHGQNNPNKVNFNEAMDILEKDVSTGFLRFSKTLPKKFQSRPLEVIDAQTIPNIDEKINPHYYFNDSLILNTLVPNGYEFKYRESVNPTNSELANVYVVNELSLSQRDISNNQTYIHVPSVGQSTRYFSNSSHSLNVSFHEVGNVYQSKFTRELAKAPTAPQIPKLSYISFAIEDLKINNSNVDNLIGMVYVLDRSLGIPTTEPLFFLCNNNNISLLNTANKEAIFPINEIKNQYLVLRLLHRQAIDPKKFLSLVSNPSEKVSPLPYPVNFAVSAIPIFDDKDSFIESTSFPDRFTLVSNSASLASDSDFIPLLKTSTNESLPVTTKITLKKIDALPTEGISRTFIKNSDNTVLLSSTKIEKNSSDPLITLSNIRFTFKNPPKGVYVYFTAFYTDKEDNIKSPNGLHSLLSYDYNDLQNQYTSTIINTNKTCQFPDIIRIFINGKISRKSHIIFHFYTISSDSQSKVYKAAVLPLYNSEGAPVRSNQKIEIPSFEFKEVQPNKYLYPGKISSQSKVLFSLSVPSVCVPPEHLLNLLSSNPGSETPKIDFSKLSKDVKMDSFIPTVSRYLTIMGPKNALSFVYYLSQFDRASVAPIFLQYVYRIFTPIRISEDFPQRFFSSYTSAILPYLKPDGTSDNVLYLIYFLKTCAYFLHIATVTILTLKKENKPIDKNLLDDIIKFSKSISMLIALLAKISYTAEVNVLYSSYLHFISPIIGYENGLPIINDHLKRFDQGSIYEFDLTPLFPPPPEVKPKHPLPEPPIQKPDVVSEDIVVRGLNMKLDFIKTFANSNNLLANCGYTNSNQVKIFENLFDSLKLSMTKAKKLVPEYIYLLSEFVRTIEHYPEISMKCANVYIPYLTYAIENVNADEFKDYELFQHYLVPILFVLHTANKNELAQYYDNLICGKTLDDKTKFIEFLETLIIHTLTPGSVSPKALAPVNISECTNAEEEYKKLQEINKSSKDINYVIFNELTVRILDFTSDYFYRSASIDISDKQAEAFSSLFIRILGYHQLETNFNDAMLTISRFVDNYYSKIYFNHTESYNKLVYLALHLVSRNLRIARSSGVAMTIHLMHMDYQTTENIIASMHYFYSNIVRCINECPSYRVDVYRNLNERLKLFITCYRYDEFVDLYLKHKNQSFKITKSCITMRSSNKSPELRIKMMHKIADQLYGYPLLRMKWLREIVNCNRERYFYAQAFEGKVQVVALIDKMIRLIGEENISEDLDYSFVEQTSEESKIDIDHCKPHLKHLLIKDLDPADDVFNSKGLIDNLNNAIKLGKAAGLPWEVRECYYLFLNIYELKRDTKELRKKSTKLGEIYNIIYMRQEKFMNEGLGYNPMSPQSSTNLSASPTQSSNQLSINQLSGNSSSAILLGSANNGEDSDNYATPPPNSVDPISTPLYFYLVVWRRNGNNTKRLIFASAIADLRKFTDFLNNPIVSRFEYGANAVAYQTFYEAEMSQSSGIVVSPVKPIKDPSFTDKIYQYTQDYYSPKNSTNNPFHRRYTFTTKQPHPNSNIIAEVENDDVKDYNRMEDLQLVVDESINGMAIERKQLQNELPSQMNEEKWKKTKPSLTLSPLSKAVSSACNGSDLAKPSLKEARQIYQKDPNKIKIISRLATKWLDEIEASVSALYQYKQLVSSNQEGKPIADKNIQNLEMLKRNAQDTIKDFYLNRKIKEEELKLAKDPLLYYQNYEEF